MIGGLTDVQAKTESPSESSSGERSRYPGVAHRGSRLEFQFSIEDLVDPLSKFVRGGLTQYSGSDRQ
jgi:hypothetical protein